MARQAIQFGIFTLDLARHRLTGPEGEIGLRPKSFEVLKFMVERPGRVLPKLELMESIWPDVTVTEESLTRCISDVRIALQDTGRTIVRTVPKIGYLFDLPVRVIDETDVEQQHDVPTIRSIDSKSVAEDAGRRLATVVFVDVQGEIAKLSASDAEAAMLVHDDALSRVSAIMGKHGATMQPLPGEGIVSLFGVPLAQEDHAVRACHAALECHRTATTAMRMPGTSGDETIRLKVGIASGEITFRPSDREQTLRTMGPAMDLAKRLGRTALPGTTLIAGETRRLADGHIRVAFDTEVAIGASSETCRLEGEVPSMTRFKANLVRGLTRFVGRDAELEQLRRAEQLVMRGHGQIVAIVGEAGVGKSRLVHELINVPASEERVRVLSCAAVPYGTAAGFLPIIELLRDYFAVEVSDDVQVIRGKIAARLLALDRSMEPSIPAMLALLDVPVADQTWLMLDPGERRRRTIEAIKYILQHEARARPLLLIVEDLHWIDGQTRALLDSLADSLTSTRLLLIVTYRPEYRHGWGSKSIYRQIRLDALAADSTAQLLDALVGNDPGLAPFKQLLIRRGNPFFLEEAIRTLVDTRALVGERGAYHLTRAIGAIQLPPTVKAILADRIDRLDPETKRILQVASVIGKSVPLSVLESVAAQTRDDLAAALDRLQSSELMHQTALVPAEEFTFRHALTHEVAYAGLLRTHQRELHARVVEAMETLYLDRLSEHTERLAHHAYRGELGEKAVHYLRLAGLKAAARSALTEARAWLEQALDALGRLPEEPRLLEQGFEIRLELRGVLYQLGDARSLLERLREAEAIAGQLHDECRRSRVSSFMTSIHTMLGELDEAVAVGEQTVSDTRGLRDLELTANAANYLVQALYYRGDYERAIELAAETLATWPANWVYKYHVGNPAPASVFNRAFLAMSHAQLGNFSEAARHEADAIQLAEPTQNAFTIAMAHVAAPSLFMLKGDWSTAKSRLERYISVARTGNIIGLLTNAVSAYAWVMAELDERAEAEKRLQEALGLLEQQAPRGIGNLCWPYYSAGRTCLLLGRTTDARGLADRALALSTSQPGFAAHALNLLGDIACRPDQFDAESAEGFYRQALVLSKPRSMRPLLAQCNIGLSNLFQSIGDVAQAERHAALGDALSHDMSIQF